MTYRENVYQYVKEKYQSEPEYLWRHFPNTAIMRHKENRKWFAVIMDISKDKLGLKSDVVVDILNVKIDDEMLMEVLIQQQGIFRGYHMNKTKWISILLDGTVDLDEIFDYIDLSFKATS